MKIPIKNCVHKLAKPDYEVVIVNSMFLYPFDE